MNIFEIFDLKKIAGRFQNSLIMILINRFGQNFVQIYVEFNGGGREIKIKAHRVRGTPLQKDFCPLQKNFYFSLGLSTGRRFGNQNKPSLPHGK